MTAQDPLVPRCATCGTVHPEGCAYRGTIAVEASCPRCGGGLGAVVNQRTVGSQVGVGTETNAIVECASCERQWHVLVRLQAHNRDPGGAVRKAKERAAHRLEVVA